MRPYRCEAASVEGFIQQLAVAYITHGYWFYVTGWIPTGKDPRTVDAKLVRMYGVDKSKWARARSKRAGSASIQYLRHGRFFIVIATHGCHPFFERERTMIRDARRVPIRYAGYSVSYRGGHAHVRIENREYLERKASLLELAEHRSIDTVRAAFLDLRYERYAPVRRQLFNILLAVNRARQARGFSQLEPAMFRWGRRVVKPFGPEGSAATPPARPEETDTASGTVDPSGH